MIAMTDESPGGSPHTGRLEKIFLLGALANVAAWIKLGVEHGYFGVDPAPFYLATFLGLPLLAAGGGFLFVVLYILLVIQWRQVDPHGV